jgi:hypothetical protein
MSVASFSTVTLPRPFFALFKLQSSAQACSRLMGAGVFFELAQGRLGLRKIGRPGIPFSSINARQLFVFVTLWWRNGYSSMAFCSQNAPEQPERPIPGGPIFPFSLKYFKFQYRVIAFALKNRIPVRRELWH